MTDPLAAIDARGLVKDFGEVRAIDHLDLRVDVGAIHGLVGPNGAGKTTLLRILFGLVRPDDGAIVLLGRERDATDTEPIREVGGFVEEPRFYPYLTARKNLELMADLDGGGRERIDEMLELVHLEDRADRKVGGFSSGMRQRLGLAASLLRRPLLLLLDEPTVGLDPNGVREMLHLVRMLAADGVTIVISSHNMTELEGVCDGVTVIADGTAVWQGSMERLRAESPAPAHRVETSDDQRAMQIADAYPAVQAVVDPDGWLTVSADQAALDTFVVELGTNGIAVRRLELLMTALESMFFTLTGVPAPAPSPVQEPTSEIEVT
ncbi:MAG: type transport system ATP-binding protein [Actinomycetota bacterium]|jgi:ABC-2 type transport system ATP-binding protein|nr:type transport system ATP-binding protein [Actinomycetota bacterium]